jgi:hypothetical protein
VRPAGSSAAHVSVLHNVVREILDRGADNAASVDCGSALRFGPAVSRGSRRFPW